MDDSTEQKHFNVEIHNLKPMFDVYFIFSSIMIISLLLVVNYIQYSNYKEQKDKQFFYSSVIVLNLILIVILIANVLIRRNYFKKPQKTILLK